MNGAWPGTDGCLSLTHKGTHETQAVTAFYEKRIHLKSSSPKGFLTSFDVKILEEEHHPDDKEPVSSRQGEGLAFVVTSSSNSKRRGNPHSDMGYAGLDGGFVVELDMRKSPERNDPDESHISVLGPGNDGKLTALHTPANSKSTHVQYRITTIAYKDLYDEQVRVDSIHSPAKRPANQRVAVGGVEEIGPPYIPISIPVRSRVVEQMAGSFTGFNQVQIDYHDGIVSVFFNDLVVPKLQVQVGQLNGDYLVGFASSASHSSMHHYRVCNWNFERTMSPLPTVVTARARAGLGAATANTPSLHNMLRGQEPCDPGFSGPRCTVDSTAAARECIMTTPEGCHACTSHVHDCRWCSSTQRCVPGALLADAAALLAQNRAHRKARAAAAAAQGGRGAINNPHHSGGSGSGREDDTSEDTDYSDFAEAAAAAGAGAGSHHNNHHHFNAHSRTYEKSPNIGVYASDFVFLEMGMSTESMAKLKAAFRLPKGEGLGASRADLLFSVCPDAHSVISNAVECEEPSLSLAQFWNFVVLVLVIGVVTSMVVKNYYETHLIHDAQGLKIASYTYAGFIGSLTSICIAFTINLVLVELSLNSLFSVLFGLLFLFMGGYLVWCTIMVSAASSSSSHAGVSASGTQQVKLPTNPIARAHLMNTLGSAALDNNSNSDYESEFAKSSISSSSSSTSSSSFSSPSSSSSLGDSIAKNHGGLSLDRLAALSPVSSPLGRFSGGGDVVRGTGDRGLAAQVLADMSGRGSTAEGTASAHFWLLLIFSVVLVVAGVLCFLVEREWTVSLSPSSKIPLYAILGSSLCFTIIFVAIEIGYLAQRIVYTIRGAESSAVKSEALSHSVTEMRLLSFAAFMSGIFFGLTFGTMDVQDASRTHIGLALQRENLYCYPVSTITGAITGLVTEYVKRQNGGGGLSRRQSRASSLTSASKSAAAIEQEEEARAMAMDDDNL